MLGFRFYKPPIGLCILTWPIQEMELSLYFVTGLSRVVEILLFFIEILSPIVEAQF